MVLNIIIGWWAFWGMVVGALMPVLRYALMWIGVLRTFQRQREGMEPSRAEVYGIFALQGVQEGFGTFAWWRSSLVLVGTSALAGWVVGAVLENLINVFF